MSLITKAILSSGVLFGGCWLSVNIIKACINEILVKAALDSLDDDVVQKDIYEHLCKIFARVLVDSDFKENLKSFYRKLSFDPTVEKASKNLMALTLQNNFVIGEAVKTIKLPLRKKTFSDLTIHDKSFKAAFKWRSNKTNCIPIVIKEINEQVMHTSYILVKNELFEFHKMKFSDTFENYLKGVNSSFSESKNANKQFVYKTGPKNLSNSFVSSARTVVNDYFMQKKEDSDVELDEKSGESHIKY